MSNIVPSWAIEPTPHADMPDTAVLVESDGTFSSCLRMPDEAANLPGFLTTTFNSSNEADLSYYGRILRNLHENIRTLTGEERIGRIATYYGLQTEVNQISTTQHEIVTTFPSPSQIEAKTAPLNAFLAKPHPELKLELQQQIPALRPYDGLRTYEYERAFLRAISDGELLVPSGKGRFCSERDMWDHTAPHNLIGSLPRIMAWLVSDEEFRTRVAQAAEQTLLQDGAPDKILAAVQTRADAIHVALGEHGLRAAVQDIGFGQLDGNGGTDGPMQTQFRIATGDTDCTISQGYYGAKHQAEAVEAAILAVKK